MPPLQSVYNFARFLKGVNDVTIRLVLVASLICLFLVGAPAVHASAIDSTLFTTYNLGGNNTNISWSVCGSLPGTSGCYGGGSLGPFGRIGAMIEGNPRQNLKAGTVTRYILMLATVLAAMRLPYTFIKRSM